MIQLLGISLISATLYVVIKKYSPEYTVMAQIGAVLLILIASYPYMKDVIDFYYEYTEYTSVSNDYVKIVLKTAGIAVLTQFASDICKDSGQSALAGKIEFSGKLMIAVIALPMAETLIEVAVSVINMR